MNQSQIKRKIKTRRKIGLVDYRISVKRSNRNFSAQLIEVKTGKVIFGAVDRMVLAQQIKGKAKTQRAALFGSWFAEKIKDLISGRITFDRSGYRYHGRVKAFVEGLRLGKVII